MRRIVHILRMKLRIAIFAVILISAAIIYFRPTTEWTQCRICGVQQIERGIARRIIPAWSVYELDEYGTYAAWKKQTGSEQCEHDFRKVKHKTPAVTLEELHEQQD